jgi:hypothetical protein
VVCKIVFALVKEGMEGFAKNTAKWFAEVGELVEDSGGGENKD